MSIVKLQLSLTSNLMDIVSHLHFLSAQTPNFLVANRSYPATFLWLMSVYPHSKRLQKKVTKVDPNVVISKQLEMLRCIHRYLWLMAPVSVAFEAAHGYFGVRHQRFQAWTVSAETGVFKVRHHQKSPNRTIYGNLLGAKYWMISIFDMDVTIMVVYWGAK